VHRRAKLWAETVDALRGALANRPTPDNPADAGLVFITRWGDRWTTVTTEQSEDGKIKVKDDDALAKEFGKLLRKLNLKRPGHNFYTLRRVFETVGGGSLDQVAVDHIMGHADDSMASVYRQEIPDARLEAVAKHVHKWLFDAKAQS
jgi:hypothetical protein